MNPIEECSLVTPALALRLKEIGEPEDGADGWPVKQLETCWEHGFFQGFYGVTGRDTPDRTVAQQKGYIDLARQCLTTAFAATQQVAALRRIERIADEALSRQVLKEIEANRSYVTVGLSQLTTSGRHGPRPLLRVEQRGDQLYFDGVAPWVTGAKDARWLVIGGESVDGTQRQALVRNTGGGIEVMPQPTLLGLDGSQTTSVRFSNVAVPSGHEVMTETGGGGGVPVGVGGLHTIALAIGHGLRLVDHLMAESEQRGWMAEPASMLMDEGRELESLALAALSSPICIQTLRVKANGYVNRAARAAMVVAKGAGFVKGHRINRLWREAAFFSVWSCPEAVTRSEVIQLAAGRP